MWAGPLALCHLRDLVKACAPLGLRSNRGNTVVATSSTVFSDAAPLLHFKPRMPNVGLVANDQVGKMQFKGSWEFTVRGSLP